MFLYFLVILDILLCIGSVAALVYIIVTTPDIFKTAGDEAKKLMNYKAPGQNPQPYAQPVQQPYAQPVQQPQAQPVQQPQAQPAQQPQAQPAQQPAFKFCSQCGAKLAPETAFCTQCGNKCQ